VGYTHYWDHKGFTPEQWDKLVCAAGCIMDAAGPGGMGVELAGWDSKGTPVLSAKEISFNGAGEEGYETFKLTPAASEFDFCKTARRPYDAVVVAVLRAAAHINPRFQWRSDGQEYERDGSLSEDFKPARVLLKLAGVQGNGLQR
jgi:hypothetical protein